MAFLDKSVLEESSIGVSPHKIFSMGDVALHVRVAYFKGCILAAMELSASGKVEVPLKHALKQLCSSLRLEISSLDEYIDDCESVPASERVSFVKHIGASLVGDEIRKLFLEDFKKVLANSSMSESEIEELCDMYARLIFDCDDWRGMLAKRELEAQRERIAAKVYKHGDTKTITLPGGATMELIYCAPGEFTMGCPKSELKKIYGDGYDETTYDEDVHQVKLTKGFWLGRYPVTIGQWKSVVEGTVKGIEQVFSFMSSDQDLKDWKITKSKLSKHPSFNSSGISDGQLTFSDNCPVFDVAWTQCRNFADRVSRLSGLQVRLPTEAEWEYACRSGHSENQISNITEFANVTWKYHSAGFIGSLLGDEDHSWECVGIPREIGQGRQNTWGFYDMLGNVKEWCSDVYDKYGGNDTIDPHGPVSGCVHVCRGTSENDSPKECRPSRRSKVSDDTSDSFCFDHIGLRLAFDSVDIMPSEMVEPGVMVQKKQVSDDYIKRLLSFWTGLVERYGREGLMYYGFIAGSILAILVTGFCIRWWLATIVTGIASAIFGEMVNHGGFSCLIPIASVILTIILFFCGV